MSSQPTTPTANTTPAPLNAPRAADTAPATSTAPVIDEEKLTNFVHRAVQDFGVAMSAALTMMGDKLGLYRSLAENGPMTPEELARRTGTTEKYVLPWCVNQASASVLDYDPGTGRYSLPPEHAVALTDETSPFFVMGGYQIVNAVTKAEPRLREAFRTGAGMYWGEHDPELFEGTERFFRPGYLANLVSSWIPALDGVKAKLERGARVADVGCGHGASTVIMAEAFPKSRFYGFDFHDSSIRKARQAAARAKVEDRATFEAASALEFGGGPYDLIAFFDCLHDMGEPEAVLRRAAEQLAADGTVMVVEPMAGEKIEENFNPVGRVFSGASVLVCSPNAIATGKTCLGTLVPEKRLREIAKAAGLPRFRRAAETPFNRIFEMRW